MFSLAYVIYGIPMALIFLYWFLTKGSPNYKGKFGGKVVVITGASSGIGYELAKQLSAYKPKLVLAARTTDKLESLKKECLQAGAEDVLLVSTDVSKRDQCKRLIDQTVEKFQTINVLFLNAGVAQACQVSKITDPEVMEQIIRTNYFGAVDTAFYALPYLRKENGHIAVTSSVVSKLTMFGASSYCASNAALNSFFDTLRKEEKNIKITVLCPGYVPTDVVKNSLTGDGTPSGRNHSLHFVTPLKAAVQIMLEAVAANRWEVWYTWGGCITMTLRGAFPNFMDRLFKLLKI